MPRRCRLTGATASATRLLRQPAATNNTEAAEAATRYDIQIVCTLADPNCDLLI
jgi:hypothetical protein